MRANQQMLDAAWAEFKRVAMIPATKMSTKEKLEFALNAALAQIVEPPRESLYVESKVRL